MKLYIDKERKNSTIIVVKNEKEKISLRRILSCDSTFGQES